MSKPPRKRRSKKPVVIEPPVPPEAIPAVRKALDERQMVAFKRMAAHFVAPSKEEKERAERGTNAIDRAIAQKPLIEALVKVAAAVRERDKGGAPKKLPRRAEAEIRRRIGRGEPKIAPTVAAKYPGVMDKRSWQRHVRRLQLELKKRQN
jgi:hypothetical protein